MDEDWKTIIDYGQKMLPESPVHKGETITTNAFSWGVEKANEGYNFLRDSAWYIQAGFWLFVTAMVLLFLLKVYKTITYVCYRRDIRRTAEDIAKLQMSTIQQSIIPQPFQV